MNTSRDLDPSSSRWTIDAHAHGLSFLPGGVRRLRRFADRAMPADQLLSAPTSARPRGVVACAVGDSLVTRWWRPRSPWQAVLHQLQRLRAEAEMSNCTVADRHTEGLSVSAPGQTAVFLGLEGGDAIGPHLDRVAVLDALGVRVVGIVHYADNPYGTICMNWNGTAHGADVARGRRPGLTGLGEELLRELESRTMLVDLAHADTTTIQDVCTQSRRPVLCSHTGAAQIHNFPRYLPDHDLQAIASTGSVIGLWPYRDQHRAMSTLDDFARHAEHIANVVGVDHVCIGTDTNGVPRLINGYDGPQDVPKLFDALSLVGFSENDIDKIAGINAARLLINLP